MQTILFHPDYTVGSGITPDLLTSRHRERSRAITAGGEFHPALRTPQFLRRNAIRSTPCDEIMWEPISSLNMRQGHPCSCHKNRAEICHIREFRTQNHYGSARIFAAHQTQAYKQVLA